MLIASKPLFRDRDEEEIRGYRDALAWIHDHSSEISLDESTLKRLHAMARGQIWDAGQYKDKDGDIIERHANGVERIRFKPTPAKETPGAMEKLIDTWNECMQEKWTPPAVALAAFNLDFEAAAKFARFTFLCGYYVTQVPQRPTWNKNDFFGDQYAHLAQ